MLTAAVAAVVDSASEDKAALSAALESSEPPVQSRRQNAINRISQAYGDTVLLLLILGAVGEQLWTAYIADANWVALLYVGGFVGVLFAYFGFMFFGALYVLRQTDRFWLSLHPINFGLCMAVYSLGRFADQTLTLWLLGLSIWAAVFVLPARCCAYKKWLCGLCLLVIPIGRFTLEDDWRLAASYVFGMFILAVVARLFVERRHQQRKLRD